MRRLKSAVYRLLPLTVRVAIFTKRRMDDPCGYGEKFSVYLNRAFDTFLDDEEKKDATLINKLTKDVVSCWLKYQALPYEYFLFGFRNKSQDKRASFLTDMVRLKAIGEVSDTKEFLENVNDKFAFFNRMKPYYGREAMLVDQNTYSDDFVTFALKVKRLFIKPLEGSKGFGAISADVNTKEDALKLLLDLKSKNVRWIAEEKVIQAQEMAKWCSTCVNTVRIPSFLHDDGIHILQPFFRTGHEGSIVDNAGQGGVFTVLDPKTGIATTDGIDEYGRTFETHPDSGLHFKGWQLPRWNELLCIVEAAHKSIPSQKYIGWDFALSENGWVLIEGNRGQMVGQYSQDRGIKEEFLKLLNS